MEDVSTGVLEKIKNIWEVKIKPRNVEYTPNMIVPKNKLNLAY